MSLAFVSMSWICNKCETENGDSWDICEVCDAHAPRIIQLDYNKVSSEQLVEIRWDVRDCDTVSLVYKGVKIDVSSRNRYKLPYSTETKISLILTNDVTTRTFNYSLVFPKNAEKKLIESEQEEKEKREREEEENRRQRELNAWRSACRKKSSRGYGDYLSEFPIGTHSEEAKRRMEECKAAEKEAQRQDAIKAEEEAWKSACIWNTSFGFASFMSNYPYSRYKEDAKTKLSICKESEAWVKAKTAYTITALNGFVQKYPRSIHISEAESIISGIRAREEEDRNWNTANERNTKTSYKEYLARYPNGRYATIAKEKMKTFGSGVSGGVIAIVVIIAVFIIWAIVSANSDNNTQTLPAEKTEQIQKPVSKPQGSANTNSNQTGKTVQNQQPNSRQQVPTSSISGNELIRLEDQTERLIKGMEVAKGVGDTRNAKAFSTAKQNLETLKNNGSKKYNSLKNRYDAL